MKTTLSTGLRSPVKNYVHPLIQQQNASNYCLLIVVLYCCSVLCMTGIVSCWCRGILAQKPWLTVGMRYLCWLTAFEIWSCKLWPNITPWALFQTVVIHSYAHKKKTHKKPLQTTHLERLFVIVLSWILTFNILTEACSVWNAFALTLGWISWDVKCPNMCL